MKKLVLGLMVASTLGAALPASAAVVIGENRHGNVVVHEGRVHHHRVRYVYYDHHHHRHYGWR